MNKLIQQLEINVTELEEQNVKFEKVFSWRIYFVEDNQMIFNRKLKNDN